MTDRMVKILAFFWIQYTLGRRGSFPYGILVNFSLLKISILVIISDIIQIILILNFFEIFVNKLDLINRIKKRLRRKPGNSKKNRLEKFKKYGGWGILIVSSLPFAGGALSGSVLAVSLEYKKWKAFFLILSGCVIGTGLYFIGFFGIIYTIK